MSQSLAKLYTHIVFSTKDRFPFLCNRELQQELNAYIGGIIRTLNSQPVVVNGVKDHLHIFCTVSKNSAVSKLVGEIKRVSSIWIKTKDKNLSKFHWQDGYCALSIGRSEINNVCAYIENQEEHHSITTFQDEYRKFLTEYEIEYDEQYVWD